MLLYTAALKPSTTIGTLSILLFKAFVIISQLALDSRFEIKKHKDYLAFLTTNSCDTIFAILCSRSSSIRDRADRYVFGDHKLGKQSLPAFSGVAKVSDFREFLRSTQMVSPQRFTLDDINLCKQADTRVELNTTDIDHAEFVKWAEADQTRGDLMFPYERGTRDLREAFVRLARERYPSSY